MRTYVAVLLHVTLYDYNITQDYIAFKKKRYTNIILEGKRMLGRRSDGCVLRKTDLIVGLTTYFNRNY